MTSNTTQGTAYFNLADYIRSVQCPDVASQMAQSAAFAIDVRIQSAVRALFKQLQAQHAEAGFERLTDMSVALRERAFAEEQFGMVGPDALGPVKTIKQLSAVREYWQILAQELTNMTFDWQGVPRNYQIRSIEEMLTREVKFSVKPVVEARIRTLVARRAGDASEADVAKVVERRLEREKQRANDTATRLMEQQDALVTIYEMVNDLHVAALTLTPADGYTDIEFHDLDVLLQQQMIEGALRGAARAEDFATSSSSITDAEFDEVSFAVLKVERELGAVLKSPKYEAPERVRQAASAV